jgi:hypothetical protein
MFANSVSTKIPKAIFMFVSVLAHEHVTMQSHMTAGTAQLHH